MPPKGNKQTQEVGTSQDTSTASEPTVASVSQPVFQFMEGSAMDWTVDDSSYKIQNLEGQM